MRPKEGVTVKEIIPEPSAGQARDHAAKLVGVNPRYVQDTKAIDEKSPETFKKVQDVKRTDGQHHRTPPRRRKPVKAQESQGGFPVREVILSAKFFQIFSPSIYHENQK